MKTVCDINMCTACMACVEICPKRAITIEDALKHNNAMIDKTKCIGCGICEKVCQKINPLPLHKPEKWYQGWSNEPDERRKSSSGAFAHSLAKQVISEGGYVAACKFEQGSFKYSLVNTLTELNQYRTSKYVKSNPGGIYQAVKRQLAEESKVLFIGLPCHVMALKKFLGREYRNLITVDLICHGSPSPKLLEMFLNQYDLSLKSIKNIYFRQKGDFRLRVNQFDFDDRQEICFTHPAIKDRYSIAFLYGLIYTENCYHCLYAGIERVADITLGDSWGSDLDDLNRKKGISLALCQTEKGLSLLQRSSLELFDVDIKKAIASNYQLREPFPMPTKREVFFNTIAQEKSFNTAVRKSFPKACFRVDLKDFLLKIGILQTLEESEYNITITKE